MTKIRSVEDLNLVKQRALAKIAVRLQGENIDNLVQIYVGMDATGIEAGAKEIYYHLWNAALGKDVVVLQTAKIDNYQEPVVKVVLPQNQKMIVFEKVTLDKANELISDFVEKGATCPEAIGQKVK